MNKTATSAAATLQKHFGFDSFRGEQARVIECVLAGGHALVIMPTGHGKSLCFQIPALMQDGLTVVLSPLIALMKDQVDGLQRRGIDATYINSSLTREERETRYAGIRTGKYRLLYVTPERFRKDEFCAALATRTIDLLAVDEAHCVSEWGHDFRPDYSRIAELRARMNHPTTIALTATATPDVQTDIVRQLGLTENEIELFHEGIDRPNLTLTVEDTWGDQEKLGHILRARDTCPGSGIVYFVLIKTLERFSGFLRQVNVPHLIYHGQLAPHTRKQVQDSFMGGEAVLVLATNAFGMGIDKEAIRYVVHADTPGSMESYYQEIGRAGRDGKPSVCTLLYAEDDLSTQMEFIRWRNPDDEYYQRVVDLIEHEHEKINAHGLDWLRTELHAKHKHDRRLETVLGMLDRYGVTTGTLEDGDMRVAGELPAKLTSAASRAEKLRRDQEKLLALVQYAKHDGDPKAYIHHYFGLPYHGA